MAKKKKLLTSILSILSSAIGGISNSNIKPKNVQELERKRANDLGEKYGLVGRAYANRMSGNESFRTTALRILNPGLGTISSLADASKQQKQAYNSGEIKKQTREVPKEEKTLKNTSIKSSNELQKYKEKNNINVFNENSKRVQNDKQYQKLLKQAQNDLNTYHDTQEKNIVESFTPEKGFVGQLQKGEYAVASGFSQGFEGIRNTTLKILGQTPTDRELKPTAMQQIQQKIRQNETNAISGAMQDMLYSYGQMMPQMALANMGSGVPTKGLQTATNLLSFSNYGGSAYQQARNEGYSDEQATRYGLVNGALETSLEKVLGGFESLYGKSATGKLTNTIMGKLIKNPALRKTLTSMTGEFTEEYLQEFLDPIVREALLDEDNGVGIKDAKSIDELTKNIVNYTAQNFFSKDNLYAGILGSLNSGMVEAPANFTRQAQMKAQGRDFDTGFTKEEQARIDKLTDSRVEQAVKEGATDNEKLRNKIQKEVINDIYQGNDNILEIMQDNFGEDITNLTNKRVQYETLTNQINELQDQFKNEIDNGGANAETINNRIQELENQRRNLNYERDADTFNQRANEFLDKNYLFKESYNENQRSKQTYDRDISKYSKTQQESINEAQNYEWTDKEGKLHKGILDNSNRTASIVDLSSKIAEKIGAKVRYVNDSVLEQEGIIKKGRKVNGYNVNGEIVINLDSARRLEYTTGHEITHSLEGTDAYNKLQSYLKEFVGEKEWNNRKSQIEENYADVSGVDIDSEITSDLVGEYLFNNTEFINNLSTNKSLFNKIYNEIKYMYNLATAGSKEQRDLERLKKKFADALKNNKQEVKNASFPDTRYSLSVKEANTGVDNQGNKVAKGMQEFMADSKATDENGNLITVYHTTTDAIPQFNEFNPVGTPYYKFGDQVVNYYTNSKDMSGSYADQDYVMADTKKIESIKDIEKYIHDIYIQTGNQYNIQEVDGKYQLLEQKPISKEAIDFLNKLNEDEMQQMRDNIYYDEKMANTPYEKVFSWDNFDKELQNKFNSALEKYMGTDELVDLQREMIKYVENPSLMVSGDTNGNIINTYDNTNQMFRNIKSDIQKSSWTKNNKIQYEGYVNLTNPYVIDAGGENWDSVSNTIPKKVMDEVNEITKNKELKQALTDLANKSVYNHNELYSQQDQEKYDDYRYKTKLIKDSELRDAVETCAMFQLEYDDYASKFDYLPKGSEGINEQLKSVPFGKDETINDFVREYGQLYKDNMEYGTPESYFKQNYKNILGKEVENLNSQELFNLAFQDFREEFYEQELAQNSSTNDIVKEVIEMNKNGANYDGVIMKNVIDYGGKSETRAPHDLYVTFNSNQFKAIDNTTPTEDPDIRYSLSVSEANTTEDNEGRKLSKDQLRYFKDTKAVDNDGNLITVYHTTTNAIPQFNEFNPVGTDYYRFGDQVVNFFTNSKTMSGSYADYEYQMADTSKITDKKGVNDILVETNNKLNGDRIFVIETNDNGTYFLYDKLHKNNHLMTKLYKSQEELFKNIKQDLQERAGFREKTQYEGYVNITNPYIIDGKEANWDSILTGYDEMSVRYANEISQEDKQELIDLAKESKRKNDAIYDELKELYSKEWDIKKEHPYLKEEEYKKYLTKKDYNQWQKIQNRIEEIKSKQHYEDDYFRENVGKLQDKINNEFNMNYSDYDLYRMANTEFERDNLKRIFGRTESTNEIVKDVLEKNKKGSNYDGVIIKNILDYGSTTEFDDNGAAQDVYVTFNSNQFKAIDNTTPTKDADIRYSLSHDSQGRELSEGQQEYFKNSKVRDDEGNLKVMYHGTPDTNFTIFENNRANSGAGLKGLTNKGFYFTDTKQGAEQYAIPRGERGIGETPGVKEVYLNMTNPLVVDSVSKEGIKQIKDFFGIKGNKKITFNNIDNYVNKMLYDDAYNLRSEEQRQTYFNSTGYDGVILKGQYGDEYVVFNSNQIKNIDNKAPTSSNDIRYSLSTKDNQGRELSKQQQEYFKDSKVRDEQGRLLEVYHGTPNPGFTIFDTNKSGQNTSSGEYGLYFTDSKDFADEFSYERLETDSMFFDQKGKKGEVYPVYLNAKNVLDFANLTEQEINDLYKYASNLGQLDGKEKFVENMLKWQQIGNHQLMKGNLDLKAIADNSNYDGIKAKLNVQGNENEYIVFNSNQIKNTDNTHPTEDPDIRYSLTQAEQNDLDGLQALEDSGWTELTPEEAQRKAELERKRDIETKYPELENIKSYKDLGSKYYNYQDLDDFNSKVLDRIKDTATGKKRNGKKVFTKDQWLGIAEMVGSNLNAKTSAELEKYAVQSWFSEHPNRKENLNREGKKYNRFTIDEWVNAVYKGAGVGEEVTQTKKQAPLEQILTENTPLTEQDLDDFERFNNERPIDNEIAPPEQETQPIEDTNQPLKQIILEKQNKSKKGIKTSEEQTIKTAQEVQEEKQNNKIRKFVESAVDSEAVDKLVDIQDLDTEKMNYVPISNKKTLDSANTKYDALGYDESLNYIKAKINDKNVTLDDIALAERLIQESARKGDVQTTSDLIMDTAIIGTELGQKVQALSIIKRLTPEGQLKALNKIVNRNKSIDSKQNIWGDVKITDAMAKEILGAYKQDGSYDQNDLNDRVEHVKQQIADQMKVTIGDKLNAWRYLSMLGNPKTHLRNIISNVAMKGAFEVKNATARTIEDVFLSENRTKTWKKSSQVVKDFAKQMTQDLKGEITGEGKFNETSEIENERKIFKTKAMNFISDFNSNMLEGEDWFFSSRAFESTFREYLTAQGIKTQADIDNNPEIIQKGINHSIEQAQIATFRQYSKLASMINGIENKSKVGKLAIESVIPFKKTPINVAKAGLSYSPLGLIKSVSYDAYQVKTGNMEASTMIDHMAQGLTGTSLTLLGYALAKAGILKGSGGDDKDDKYDNYLGKQNYSINIGGQSFSLSWLSPVAMPLFVGVEAKEQLEDKSEWDFNVIAETLAQTLDPLNEMSFMQGLTQTLSGYTSGTGKIKGMFENTAQNYVLQFFPTLFSQIASTLDDKKRSTKADKTSKWVFGDETIRKIMYKIPGLRNQLEVSTDIWGNEQEQADNIITRAFESFISPTTRKQDISTGLDDEIKRVYKQTNEKGVIPSIPYSYINYNGEKYDMTSSEYTAYKKTYGRTANEMLNSLVASSGYQNATDEEKAKMIEDTYKYASAIAKDEFFSGRDVEYQNDSLTEYNELNDLGMGYDDIAEYTTLRSLNNSIKNNKELSAEEKRLQISNNLINSNLDDEQLAYAYSKYYGDAKTMKNVVDANIPIKEYINFKSQDIKGDVGANGKTISGSRLRNVVKYVNSLNLTKVQKAMLIKSEYASYTKYDNLIFNYINSQNLDFYSKASLLRKLGFKGRKLNSQILDYIDKNYETLEDKIKALEDMGFKTYQKNGKTYVRS